MKEIWIDYFQDKRLPGKQRVRVDKVLDSFKSDKFKKEIENARKLYLIGDMETYNLVKGKLIAVTFSGTFAPTRSTANLQSYSGLIVMDLDKVRDNLQLYLSLLKTDRYVYAVWISPSGDGIKFLIYTSWGAEAHKEVYSAATEYYGNTYGIPIDTSGSDVSRLCYVSYDPNLHVNNNSIAFNERKQALLNFKKDSAGEKCERYIIVHSDKQHQKNANSKKESLKRIYNFLKKRGLSITTTYDNWVRLAFAVSNTFNYDFGYKWYIEFCKLDGAYFDEKESIKLINKSYESRISNSTFGTIVYLAEQVGYVPNFNKNSLKKL